MNALGLLLALGITAQVDAAPLPVVDAAAYVQPGQPGWGFAPVTFGPCAACAPQSVPACDGAYWAYCAIPRTRSLHLWDTYCAETAPCPCCGHHLGGWMHRLWCRARRHFAVHGCACGLLPGHAVLDQAPHGTVEPSATPEPTQPPAMPGTSRPSATAVHLDGDELPPAPQMDDDVPVADAIRSPGPSLLDLFFAPRARSGDAATPQSEGATSAPAEFPALLREER